MGGQTERVWSIMEFLQKNARAIIIALLAAGVVVAISASGDNNNEEVATQESSEVATTDEQQGPVAADAADEAEEASETATEEATDEATESEAVESEEATPAESDSESSSDENAATESDEDSESTESTEKADSEDTVVSGDVQRDEDTYTVSAKSGDSQTTLMRKLIAQYESENDVQLTAEQRLYVETNLIDDIGEKDVIEIGDEVELTGADIKVRVEEARNLSEATLALWTQYL